MYALLALLVVSIILAAVSFFLMKPPKPPNQTEETIDIPDTKIGVPIGVLFGRKKIKDMKVAWWGHVKIVKVKVDAGGKK